MVLSASKWKCWIAAAIAITLLAPGLIRAAGTGAGAGTEATAGSGKVKAKILAVDGKTPVAGATVRAFHLDSGKIFTSLPTGKNGECEISGVPFGYLDLAIETPEGTFVGNQVINVPPSGTVTVFATVTKFGERTPAWWSGKNARDVPGTRTASQGVAEVRLKEAGREFWKSPKGLAIIIGGSAVVLLAVSGGGSSSSPSAP